MLTPRATLNILADSGLESGLIEDYISKKPERNEDEATATSFWGADGKVR